MFCPLLLFFSLNLTTSEHTLLALLCTSTDTTSLLCLTSHSLSLLTYILSTRALWCLILLEDKLSRLSFTWDCSTHWCSRYLSRLRRQLSLIHFIEFPWWKWLNSENFISWLKDTDWCWRWDCWRYLRFECP